MTLNGANSYSGGTTVAGGVLRLGSSLALGATSGGLTVNGGTLDLAGNNPTVGALAGRAGALPAARGPAMLTVSTGAATADFSGAIVDGVGGWSSRAAACSRCTAPIPIGAAPPSPAERWGCRCGQPGQRQRDHGAATLQTTGAMALDNGNQLTDPASRLDTPNSAETLTLNGLVTGSGGLEQDRGGHLGVGQPSGETYSGDTNVPAGTLLADGRQRLIASSNLVISDGASVILDFGGGGQRQHRRFRRWRAAVCYSDTGGSGPFPGRH